ncbi:hypothetical protein R50072_30600 [Simiduia litorea]|uniref:hypothetical protein n=1 Tax=Simiduia litorea TaxID=1435348 RepID=UPI0036F3BBA9
MEYLCLRHRVQVARSAEVAQRLWRGAFCHGQDAYLRGHWQAAERFFGCTFAIAKIRMNDLSRGQLSAFDEAQLVISAEYFAQVLSQLSKFSEADSVLQFVRHHLLRKLAQENATQNKSACLKLYVKTIDVIGLKIAEQHLASHANVMPGFEWEKMSGRKH